MKPLFGANGLSGRELKSRVSRSAAKKRGDWSSLSLPKLPLRTAAKSSPVMPLIPKELRGLDINLHLNGKSLQPVNEGFHAVVEEEEYHFEKKKRRLLHDVLHNCLLVLFNLMLTNHFPKQLSVGLITAVYKSGDKGDMSNYRGVTVGSVIAKLFAMILDHRIAVWAEDEPKDKQVSEKTSAQQMCAAWHSRIIPLIALQVKQRYSHADCPEHHCCTSMSQAF